jgi:tetrapyrrole methylase family protein / MazG family protein
VSSQLCPIDHPGKDFCDCNTIVKMLIKNINLIFAVRKMKETCCETEARFRTLLQTIQRLRSKDGCLWDRKQKKEDMAKYILEETYELIDAIEDGSPEAIKEEMGDLLFQILFLAHISEEAGSFRLPDIMNDVNEKMIRRHPHVFGNTKVENIEDIKNNWEDIKRNTEKRNENGGGFFDNIPRSMPALERAQKVTEAASRVGFDCARTEEVLAKIEEELHEFKSSLAANDSKCIMEEIGDLLLSLVNISRFVNVNAEESLTASIAKFIDRFSYIQEKLAERAKDPAGASLKEMDDLWNESKLKE